MSFVVWGCLGHLSSPTRDQIHAPAVEAQSPNYWATGKSLNLFLIQSFILKNCILIVSVFNNQLTKFLAVEQSTLLRLLRLVYDTSGPKVRGGSCISVYKSHCKG